MSVVPSGDLAANQSQELQESQELQAPQELLESQESQAGAGQAPQSRAA